MKFRQCLLPLLIAVGAGAPSLALACIGDEPARDQIVLIEGLESRQTGNAGLPQERTMQSGGLISILAPAKAVLSIFDEKGPSTTALVALDEARYRTLSAQGGATVPPEAAMIITKVGSDAGSSLVWRRFGAPKAGIVYVRVSRAGHEGLIRLDIKPPKAVVRGGVVRGTENSQSEPLDITMFDRFELELPGAPGDGWTITPAETSGLKLVSVEAVEPGKASEATAPRVRLRFSQTSSSGYETKLDVVSGSKHFSFIVRRRPIPTC
jgi:hypothetical protein